MLHLRRYVTFQGCPALKQQKPLLEVAAPTTAFVCMSIPPRGEDMTRFVGRPLLYVTDYIMVYWLRQEVICGGACVRLLQGCLCAFVAMGLVCVCCNGSGPGRWIETAAKLPPVSRKGGGWAAVPPRRCGA